jgi:hypothetical protein
MEIGYAICLTREMPLKSVDVVKKISFRYRSVPFTDGFMNILNLKALKDISIQSSS